MFLFISFYILSQRFPCKNFVILINIRTFAPNNYNMYYYHIIDELSISPGTLQDYLAALPEWRRAEAMKFKFENGKKECAMSYRLLCSLLSEHFAITEQPAFTIGTHGKPYLSLSTSSLPLFFSLSHCKNAVACIVSDEGEVGIDVECLGRYKPSLAEYCMSKEEQQRIALADNPDLAFTLLWTKKEALLKLTGEGITDDMKTCLSSPRMQGVSIESGFNTERGYAWSIARLTV